MGSVENRRYDVSVNKDKLKTSESVYSNLSYELVNMFKDDYGKLFNKSDAESMLHYLYSKGYLKLPNEEVAIDLDPVVTIKDREKIFARAQSEYACFVQVSRIIASDYNIPELVVEVSQTNLIIQVSGRDLSNDVLEDIATRYNHLVLMTAPLSESQKYISVEVVL